MKKSFIITILILISSMCLMAQEKIGTNTYLYGDLKNSVKGKVLIWYGIDDPKGNNNAIKIFSNKGFEVISWNKLFLPGQNYSQTEIDEKISKYNFKTIIYIILKNTSMRKEEISTTSLNAKNNTITSIGSTNDVVSSVNLVFKIFSTEMGFKEPIAVINASANNLSNLSQRDVVYKIVDRVARKIVDNN